MNPANLRRRRFLQGGAIAAAGTAVSCTSEKSPWRFFTIDEAHTLEALCEQIVPADQDPGAKWAGVVHYIDRQLKGFYRQHQQVYRRGLVDLDTASRNAHGARFAELPFDRQTEVLEGVLKAKGPLAEFFNLAIAHTMQGYYGSQRHGGNRDLVSWRMLGVPDPPVRGRSPHDVTKKG
jgi:gluconate 2-dehydrogenase gamma chain